MPNFQIRTIDEIFQELLTDKQTLASLNALVDGGVTDQNSLITALNSGKVPEWVLWLYNYAVATNITDISTFTAVDEIEAIIRDQIVGKPKWYIQKALAFQYGDTVIEDPVTYDITYATIDESKQIIGSCTTLDVANKLILKLRGKNTNILTTDELNAFTSYMFRVKFGGTQLEVQNFEPDQLTLYMTIQYNGNISLATIQSRVEDAINDYINNIEFDSKFLTSSLIDKLQVLEGMVDPRFDSASALDSLGNDISFVHEYRSNAGYMEINPAFPLDTTITYVAK